MICVPIGAFLEMLMKKNSIYLSGFSLKRLIKNTHNNPEHCAEQCPLATPPTCVLIIQWMVFLLLSKNTSDIGPEAQCNSGGGEQTRESGTSCISPQAWYLWIRIRWEILLFSWLMYMGKHSKHTICRLKWYSLSYYFSIPPLQFHRPYLPAIRNCRLGHSRKSSNICFSLPYPSFPLLA